MRNPLRTRQANGYLRSIYSEKLVFAVAHPTRCQPPFSDQTASTFQNQGLRWCGLPTHPAWFFPFFLIHTHTRTNPLRIRNGEGSGTPLQYSCLENPMDRGAWKAAVHGVAESWTWLSDFTFTFHFHALEKEMATYSSVLSWKIPGMGEPGGLLSMGSHRVGHDWSDLAVARIRKPTTSRTQSPDNAEEGEKNSFIPC